MKILSLHVYLQCTHYTHERSNNPQIENTNKIDTWNVATVNAYDIVPCQIFFPCKSYLLLCHSIWTCFVRVFAICMLICVGFANFAFWSSGHREKSAGGNNQINLSTLAHIININKSHVMNTSAHSIYYSNLWFVRPPTVSFLSTMRFFSRRYNILFCRK